MVKKPSQHDHNKNNVVSCIVMIGPSMLHARGGMASVILAYREAGLFDRWPIVYLESHKEVSTAQKLLIGVKSLYQFMQLILQKKVSLLHAHIAGHISFLRKSTFLLIAVCFHTPFIIHLHGSAFRTYYENDSGKLLQLYIRFIFNKASAIVVLSEEWKSWVSNITNNRKVVLIPNPIRLPNITHHNDKIKRTLNVIFLGKWVSQKGFYDLLEAFVKVVEKSPKPVQLLCGGDGDKSMIEKQISELNLNEHVHLLGWIEGDAKEKLLLESDVLVLPSYNEVLPMAILEALAYGVPVVASRVGAIPDAVSDGVEGFLIKPGDVNAIADSILQLVSDDKLRKSISVNARNKAQSCFEDNAIMAKISVLYRELVDNEHAERSRR